MPAPPPINPPASPFNRNGSVIPQAPAVVLPGTSRQVPNLAWAPEVPTLLYSDPSQGGDGSYAINEDKALVTWRWIPAMLQEQYPITIPADTTIDGVTMTIAGGQGTRGDFEGAAWFCTSENGRLAIQPYVTSPVDKYLSNIPIPTNLISGTSQLPGLLPSSIYSMAKSSIVFKVQNLNTAHEENSCSLVAWGRKYSDLGREHWANERRRASLLNVQWPYWIGPQSANASAGGQNFTGPEVALAPGAQITLKFPIPSSYDFLLKWLLDDSTNGAGSEPLLTAQVELGHSRHQFVDGGLIQGISWRDFLACPTVQITGFQPEGFIRAFSLGSPRGGWSNLCPRTSYVSITFFSQEPSHTITLRPCLVGWLLNAAEPVDRHFSNTPAALAQRHAQAAARGSKPVKMFGDRN